MMQITEGVPVGEAIRRVRLAKGLSQQELATRAGMSVSAIAKIETGRHDPQLGTVMQIARALGIQPWQLVRMIEEDDAA